MGSVTGLRGIANKIRRIKTISRSLADAEREFKIEVDRVVDELEETKEEIRTLLDTIRSGEEKK